jgi:hypothetical protein
MKRLTFGLSFDHDGDSIEVTITATSEKEARPFILSMLSEGAQNRCAWGDGLELIEQRYLMSLVRENLLTVKGYTCGAPSRCSMPRMFFNGDQFECPEYGHKTSFKSEFIARYKSAQEALYEDRTR